MQMSSQLVVKIFKQLGERPFRVKDPFSTHSCGSIDPNKLHLYVQSLSVVVWHWKHFRATAFFSHKNLLLQNIYGPKIIKNTYPM